MSEATTALEAHVARLRGLAGSLREQDLPPDRAGALVEEAAVAAAAASAELERLARQAATGSSTGSTPPGQDRLL